MWEPRCFTTLWVSTACYRDIFMFLREGRILRVFGYTMLKRIIIAKREEVTGGLKIV
jgi:hypothetical protein